MNSITSSIISYLNSAFDADPSAIHALFCNRVPANNKLLEHPTVQVNKSPAGEDNYWLDFLGFVNGLNLSLGGEGFIRMDFTKDFRCIGFKYFPQESAKVEENAK